MTESVNVGLAFLAGVLSFVSPCVLPLIPSYLSFISGSSLEQLKSSGGRSAFLNTAFFVLGFSVVFVVLGVVLTGTFGLLGKAVQVINIAAGLIIIILGLNFIFDFWKMLNVERRFHFRQKPAGFLGSFLVGTAFGAGWSPCIGPILGSILLLAGTTGQILNGILLLAVFSLGLGVPFLLTGLFFSTASAQLQKLMRHIKAIKIGSGLFLVAIGILILLGRMRQLNALLFSLAYRLEGWQAAHPSAPAVLFGSVFLLLCLLIVFFYGKRVMRAGKFEILPIRLFFIMGFLVLSILSFTGVVDFVAILSGWLSFQGL